MLFLIGEAQAAEELPAAVGAVETPHELSAEKMMTDNLLLLGAIFFIFYFLLIRPQQKRVKMHQQLLSALKKGDRVVTNGGLMGTISKLEGNEVAVLEVSPNVKVRVARSAITEVVTTPVPSDSANDN